MNFQESLKIYLTKDEINNLLTSLSKKRSYCLLINTNKITFEDLKKYFKTLRPHPFIQNAYYYDGETEFPGKSFLFDNGAYYIIDASSLLVSYFLNINDNDLLLDMCAAPGGKSISVLLKNKNINAICNDLNKQRALLMSQNFERLGIANAIVTSSNFDNIYQNYINTFDKIILDAPCSGSGMFRKNSEMENDWSYEKVLKCSTTQKDLLEIAHELYPNIKFIKADATDFTLETKMDAVFSNAVFHWIVKRKQSKMLDCVYKSLNNGGQFVFEFGGYGNNALIHAALQKEFQARKLFYKLPFYFPTIGEYSQLLEKAGFMIVYATLFERKTELSGKDGLADWIKMFIKTPFEKVDDKIKNEIICSTVERLSKKLYLDNKWYADYVRIRFKAIKE